MYNFLDNKLSPKVTSQAACMDDYEVKNLIHSNPLIKSRGFMAFTSIKPPVDVDFELICPINIQFITISTTVGTQKTIGVEILVKSSFQFTSICKSFYTENGVTFYNPRFFSKTNPPANTNQSFCMQNFNSHSFRHFITAKFIRVRILSTDRSVPCIGKIEIWGRVSKTCSRITLETIQKLMTAKKKAENIQTFSETNTSENVDFQIPDDFKDSLTFEIMALPMTLPSGNTIDQSTLEKCISNDATYGRRGLDPFTGLPFTDNRKPKLNVSLKSRIDMFLMEHANQKDTFNIKRTVGRINKKLNVASAPLKQLKRSASDSINQDNKRFHLNMEINTNIPSNSKNDYATCSMNENLSNNDKVDSLDEAIAKVMNSSNFVCFTKKKDTLDETIDCKKCKISNNLYVLPCKHLFCRKCLLEICEVLNCSHCNTSFKKNDAVKFHNNV